MLTGTYVFHDLYDAIPQDKRDDKLSLLYEANKKNMVAVKTAVGMTDRIDIPNIVQQGGTWGPGLCSNSVDNLGKKWQENVSCPLCQNHLDNQAMALKCEVMRNEVEISCQIEEIFRDDVSLKMHKIY